MMISFFYRLVPEIPGCPKKFDIFIENRRAHLKIVFLTDTLVIKEFPIIFRSYLVQNNKGNENALTQFIDFEVLF